MDSASKAIVITGAVLIAIGLVGLGVYLFQSAAGFTHGVDKEVTAREIQTINSSFTRYEGDCLGVDIRSLVRTVQTHNKNNDSYPVKVKFLGSEYAGNNIENVLSSASLKNANKYKVSFSYDTVSGLINVVVITNG